MHWREFERDQWQSEEGYKLDLDPMIDLWYFQAPGNPAAGWCFSTLEEAQAAVELFHSEFGKTDHVRAALEKDKASGCRVFEELGSRPDTPVLPEARRVHDNLALCSKCRLWAVSDERGVQCYVCGFTVDADGATMEGGHGVIAHTKPAKPECWWASLPQGQSYADVYSPQEIDSFSWLWYSHFTAQGWIGVRVKGRPEPKWPEGPLTPENAHYWIQRHRMRLD